jgi:pantoate--beta-alanine ligase
MRVIETVEGFRAALDAERAAGRTVGFVPTMGYFHEGHTSLMAAAAAAGDVVAVSVFVNPLQFGPGEDFASYPRDAAKDREVALRAGVDILFAPAAEEMEPGRGTVTRVHVEGVSEGLEGASRPGHFTGVATVVARLFAIAAPCRAYFGEKDYQQLAVVRRLVNDLRFAVEVIGCPTVREADGLARSSRNVLLTPAERAAAPVLHRALEAGRALIEDEGERDPAAVRAAMTRVVAAEPLAVLDYAEVAAADSLGPVSPLAGDLRLLVAARFGAVRLIDNRGARCPAAAC